MFAMIPLTPGPLCSMVTRARAIAVACVLLVSVSHADASERNLFTEGGQSLTVELSNGHQARYGFHPVRLTAVNAGSQSVVWDISVHDQGMDDRTLNGLGHRERIVVPPERTVERDLLVAIGRNEERPGWSYLQVGVVTPSGESRYWRPSNSSGGRHGTGVNVSALLTNQAAGALSLAPGSSDNYHGRLNPAAASRDWRGYAAFSLIVLTPEDWETMAPAARTALGDWARMGGHLQFVGGMPGDAPTPDVPGETTRGLGGVHPPPTPEDDNQPRFDKLPAVNAANQSNSPAIATMKLGESVLRSWLGRVNADLIFDRFIIWPMVLVLMVFFVMITPINLFVLAPSRRRHRLFRTIPVISLTACALLAVAVGVGDGVGGKGERLVWIESRPGTENREFITQWQASRCGALIGTGFTVPDAAYLAPLRAPGSRVTLRVEGDRLEAGGGWFTSRATQAHFLQAARPGRGRIEWVGSASNAPQAVSTFDFPLRDVFVLHTDGAWWHAPIMRQGETTALQPMDADAVLAKLETALDAFPMAKEIQSMALRPGHYIAFTDAPPAIASLRSVRWNDTGIVTGVLATP